MRVGGKTGCLYQQLAHLLVHLHATGGWHACTCACSSCCLYASCPSLLLVLTHFATPSGPSVAPNRSLVCGALAHSYTAALYFLPPTGPTATDLILMAALSQALPLVPVVGACWTAPGGQGEAAAVAQMMAEVEQLLAAPGELVPGLQPGDIQLPTRWDQGAVAVAAVTLQLSALQQVHHACASQECNWEFVAHAHADSCHACCRLNSCQPVGWERF